MASQAESSASASAFELNALSQISAKATEQLSAVLESTEVSFEEDIPVLEHEPKLEDILNEDEAGMPTLDELGISDIVGDSGATATTIATFHTGNTEPSATSAGKEGAILRQIVLKGIANQLSQATIHNEAGLPTAMTVGKYYVIGTSHGLVLVFDSTEQLTCVLSPYQKGPSEVNAGQYGAVSALDIVPDGTRLICGYAKGLITHWDLTNNKLLRFIDNAHPPGFGVLNIRFMDDPATVIFNNTGGNVFLLKFKRILGVRNWYSECFFSGCHGEALMFEPLLPEDKEGNTLKDISVVAIATVTQVLILSIAPKLEGLISLPLKGKAKSLPQLSWYHVVIEHRSGGKIYSTNDPVLAATRGNRIHYVQATTNQKGEPHFRLLRKFEVPYDITAFRWINAYTVVALDTTERVHLVSVKDDTEIEVLDLTQVELVYGSSFFKSIETGGNVSKALVVASEHACYHSVVGYQNQLLLLGLKAVHVVSIKPWKERLGRLVRDGRMMEALQLGLDLYEGKAKAVVGLSGPPKKRKEAVAEQVVDILQAYIDIGVMMQKPSAASEEELQHHYKTLVQSAFNCCLRIRRMDLLFGSIYDTFSGEDNLSKAVFLEYLCEHIKHNKMRTIRTAVAKDFVDHYSQLGEYKLVESCILQLNPTCLDIHQVVETCWSQKLYDAMIHVYNRGLNDYTTPLLELLLQLRAALKKGKALPDEYQKIGYKLLVYIRCCLAGLAYPTGTIPKEVMLLAKTSVFDVLLAPNNTHNPSDKASYPHIHTLLEFDTREFLNVLALAFEEPDFDAAMSDRPPPGVPSRQQVVDILLQVMVNDKQHIFSPSQVGSLFTFLARQGAKHRTTIRVDEHIYDQVLDYITHADEDVINEERQQALLELWHAGVLKKFDEEKLLVKAESARFYRLCELLYEKKRNFGKVLSCYLRDPTRRHQAFSYIHAVMSEDQYTEPDREEVERAVLENIHVLLSADVRGTARLILLDFPLELAEVAYKLQANPELQFDFLQGIFDPKSLTKQEIAPPSHVVEKYIELLCRYQPEAVYNFLRANDNYRLEEALSVCAKARLLDATAYLLERSGDIMGAFKLILETLGAEVDVASDKYYSEVNHNQEMMARLERVETILQALLQFCQRNSGRLDEKARQAMWFPTFDKVHSLQKKYEKSPNVHLIDMYNQMIAAVLNSMLGYISLPDILQKIIQDPSYQFKDIKQLIMGMLETYSYEETLLKTTNHIMIHDVRGSLAHLCTLFQRGVSPNSNYCIICSRGADSLADGSKDDVVVFNCGHLYHASCLGLSSPDVSRIGVSCLICNKGAAPAPPSGRLPVETKGGKFGSDSQARKAPQEDVQLDPAQKANLKRLRESYRSRPELTETVELRLAPPRLSGY